MLPSFIVSGILMFILLAILLVTVSSLAALGKRLFPGLTIWEWSEQWVDDAADFLGLCLELAQFIFFAAFGILFLTIAARALCSLLC